MLSSFLSIYTRQIPIETTTTKDDELRVPSPPPRRLSRSSIDLRDLEQHHEKISQSDSISSLRFENYLRYSGSEPLQIKKQQKEHQKQIQEQTSNHASKQSGFFQPFNLLKHYGSEKRSKASLSSAAKEKEAMKSQPSTPKKRKTIAASDSDFMSMLRHGSEKSRKHRFKQSKNNLIYALSDSDFLVSLNTTIHDYSKLLTSEQEAILHTTVAADRTEANTTTSKSDIFKIILNKKCNDYVNLDKSPVYNKPNNCLTGGDADIYYVDDSLGGGGVGGGVDDVIDEHRNIVTSGDSQKHTPDILIGIFDYDSKKPNVIDEVAPEVGLSKVEVDAMELELNLDRGPEQNENMKIMTKNLDEVQKPLQKVTSCKDFINFIDVSSPLDDKLLNTSRSSDAVMQKHNVGQNNLSTQRFFADPTPPSEQIIITPAEEQPPGLQFEQLLCEPDTSMHFLSVQQPQHFESLLQPSLAATGPPGYNAHLLSDASTISLDLVTAPNNLLQPGGRRQGG
jgi:hypothetical protein